MFSWSVHADALKRDFTPGGFDIEHGLTSGSQDLQRRLALQWNGTLLRPPWWTAHKQRQHGLAIRHHERHGANLDVHDFWAADDTVASAVLAFLGRHNSRIPAVGFHHTTDERSLAALVRSTTDHEPWLAEHF